jgi:hypothetical protein
MDLRVKAARAADVDPRESGPEDLSREAADRL